MPSKASLIDKVTDKMTRSEIYKQLETTFTGRRWRVVPY